MRACFALCLFALTGAPAALAQTSPFVEDTESPLVQTLAHGMSAFWGDVDNDGDLDLAVANTLEPDVLYRNEGEGAFTPYPVELGPQGAVNGGGFIDVNGDGLLDFLSASIFGGALLINKGPSWPAQFERVPSVLEGGSLRDLIAGDYDLDGDADVALVQRNGGVSLLFRNLRFAFQSVSGGIPTSSNDAATACWSRVNGDQYPELLVVNVSGYPNRFYRNDAGTLRVVSGTPVSIGTAGAQGCAWGDADNDGDLDLFVTMEDSFNQAPLQDQFFENDDGTLLAAPWGDATTDQLRSISAAWGDVDNDGDLDLVVSHHDAPEVLYLNGLIGQEGRIDLGEEGDGRSMGVSLVDDDGDGDLDFFVANGGPRTDLDAERNRLFRNTTSDSTTRHWLEVDLRGTVSERFGLGARVRAYATVNGTTHSIMREVQMRPWRLAQDGYRLHFGLGPVTTLDSLVVEWPASPPQRLTNVATDRLITINEPFFVDAETPADPTAPLLRAFPNPASDLVTMVVSGVDDGPVRVEVFDALGRRIGVVEGPGVAGDARLVWDGTLAAAGRYVIRVVGHPEIEPVSVTISR